MSGKITNTSLYAEPYGDQDQGASAQQVPGAYQEPPVVPPYSVDGNHGGINQTVQQVDGAAHTTTMTMHNCSCPTPSDMGIKGVSAF